MHTLLLLATFVILCLASYLIGRAFSAIRLPYITGYLFAGALVSSFGLDLIPQEAAQDLRFVDELSLAVIAFVAGSELYLKEIRSRLSNILYTAGGILVVALALGAVTIYALTGVIPFTADMATPGRVAVALLGSTVLLALSPPSTIAVIKEVRARGPFTSTALGVTVFMDVAIIVLFAVSTSVASMLLTGASFSGGVVGVIVLDLVLAVVIGYLIGCVLEVLLRTHWPQLVKTVLVVAIGYGIFWGAGEVKALSAMHLPFSIYIEPLLIALISGFYIANFTAFRGAFDEILHDVGPIVYVAFFTLTGISLKLDLLWAVLPVALALFGVRAASIFVGSYAGGLLAGTPARQRRLFWMAFITQAGIALGLAREVAVQFPALGSAFATLIISVVVINEIVGPLFLKAALQRVGEAHVPKRGTPDEVRDVVIFGVEGQSLALARTLQASGWSVILADTEEEHLRETPTEGFDVRLVPALDSASLKAVLTKRTDAVVSLLGDDQANFAACRTAYEDFGIGRIVARVRNLRMVDDFREMGVLVVDTTSAMVNLLEQAVRAPQTAALLLHDTQRALIQVTVSNPDVDGLYLRDLRLPADVLLLDVLRNGSSVVPHGHTPLQLRDEVTLIGSTESLDVVTLKLGY